MPGKRGRPRKNPEQEIPEAVHLTQSDWEEMPTPAKPQRTSPWDVYIPRLKDGEIIGFTIDADKVAGARIALARRGKALADLKLIFRYDSDRGILAVRMKPEK